MNTADGSGAADRDLDASVRLAELIAAIFATRSARSAALLPRPASTGEDEVQNIIDGLEREMASGKGRSANRE